MIQDSTDTMGKPSGVRFVSGNEGSRRYGWVCCDGSCGRRQGPRILRRVLEAGGGISTSVFLVLGMEDVLTGKGGQREVELAQFMSKGDGCIAVWTLRF